MERDAEDIEGVTRGLLGGGDTQAESDRMKRNEQGKRQGWWEKMAAPPEA